MEETIKIREKLFRAAFPDKIYWNEGRARFSTALFKDKNGTSVDRDGDRTSEEAINKILDIFPKEKVQAIVSITAGFCYDLPAYLKYVPSPNDEYHSEIHDSIEKPGLSGSKTRKLLKKCSIEYDKIGLDK